MKLWKWISGSLRLDKIFSQHNATGNTELQDIALQAIQITNKLKEDIDSIPELSEEAKVKVDKVIDNAIEFFKAFEPQSEFEKGKFWHNLYLDIANALSDGKFDLGDLILAGQLIFDELFHKNK